jgi:hypothetical protein
MGSTTTRSPMERVLTAEPRAAIVPAASWPDRFWSGFVFDGLQGNAYQVLAATIQLVSDVEEN